MSGTDALVLGIDLGTSGPKVALADSRGRIIDSDFAPTGRTLIDGGGAEQNPSEWWTAITTATNRMLERNPQHKDRITAICPTAQWSGTVAVDERGEPLANAIIWMDSRGAPYIDKITGGVLKIEGYAVTKALKWVRRTGGAPAHAGKDPIAHILWLKHERPEIYARTYKFLEPKDYLNLKLTGLFAASFDSITLHWVTDNRDLQNIRYDDGLIAMAGIDRQKLPELRRAIDLLGPLCAAAAHQLGLSEQVQVVMGTPDLPSAAVGSGAVRDYEAHLYLGTSSWLCCHLPYKKTDLVLNMASLPSANPERYILANTQETAGGCLPYLINNILFPDDLLGGERPDDIYDRLEALAASAPPGSGQLIFLPWLYGERTPVEDRSLRGGFFNLSLSTERRHLVRAVLEGVAYNSRWLCESVERFIKRRIDLLTVIGGGAQSDLWCQIHADVLDRRVRRLRDPILANVRGAALLASVAMDYLRFEEIPDCVEVDRIFEPNPRDRAVYDELFATFLDFHKNNRRSFANLNRQR